MRGRKRSCPTKIKDWQISIWNPYDQVWLRIRGLSSMIYKLDSDTEDGSTSDEAWEEPYIKKRNGTMSLEGKPLVDAATGIIDPGQDLLNEYAQLIKCEADALIRFADPYGHTMEAYFQVTSRSIKADKDGNTISWDLDMVGESESLPYVQVTGVELVAVGMEEHEIEIDINDAPRLIQVVFTPENASNKRYSIRAGGQAIRVGNIADGSFTVSPRLEGTGTVRVVSINNGLSDAVTINVTNNSQPYMSGVLGVGVLGSMVLGRSAIGA